MNRSIKKDKQIRSIVMLGMDEHELYSELQSAGFAYGEKYRSYDNDDHFTILIPVTEGTHLGESFEYATTGQIRFFSRISWVIVTLDENGRVIEIES